MKHDSPDPTDGRTTPATAAPLRKRMNGALTMTCLFALVTATLIRLFSAKKPTIR